MKKELSEIINSSVDLDKYYIVDLHIGKLKDTTLIKLKLDSDIGIGIDECSAVSRILNQVIEERKVVDLYELEVASPGVGEPLKLERQYKKNVGRLVKVALKSGKEVEGKLLSVDPIFSIQTFVKNKFKIKEAATLEIDREEIKKVVVQVSFE